jgi:hypothetical protein
MRNRKFPRQKVLIIIKLDPRHALYLSKKWRMSRAELDLFLQSRFIIAAGPSAN